MNGKERKANRVPAVCATCGYVFRSPIDLTGSRNCAVIGCSTNCPRCGGDAAIADSHSDAQGYVHVHDFVWYIQGLKDRKLLEEIKNSLEAANSESSPDELAQTLTEIEPSFAKLADAIRSVPVGNVSSIVTILIAIITLVITYRSWQDSEENHDQEISLQQSQLELSREQFEYQKHQDGLDRGTREEAEKRDEALQAQIDELRSALEHAIAQVDNRASSSSTNGSGLKGSCRNLPCPCGSGLKAKKCHPNGYP